MVSIRTDCMARQLLSLFLPLAVSIAVTSPAQAERWAILCQNAVEKSGLTELLTVELSAVDGIELVERQAIDRAFREMELAAIFGNESVGARLQLGKTLGAQRLFILRQEPFDHGNVLSGVIVDTELGIRLGSLRIAETTVPSQPSSDAERATTDGLAGNVRALVDLAEETRIRFRGGVRRVVGIAPMRCLNASGYYGKYGPNFVELLTRAVIRQQGVAVLELEESQRILKEIGLVGGESSRKDLFRFVTGEYLFETDGPAKAEETVEIRLRIRRERNEQSIASGTRPLAEAARWLAEDVTATLAVNGTDPGAAATTLEEQFALLRKEVLEIDRYGMTREAEQCAAAAELIGPDDFVIGLVGYRAIENDETLSPTEKVDAKLLRAEHLAEKGLINSAEFGNLLSDAEMHVLEVRRFKPGFYQHRDELGRIFCDFHQRVAPLVRNLDPSKTQRDVRPLFRQLLPRVKCKSMDWLTARSQALPAVYYHSVIRWAWFFSPQTDPFSSPVPMAAIPGERNPHWTLDGLKRIILESTDDARNAELPLTLPQLKGKMEWDRTYGFEMHMGWFLWLPPAVCTEDELRRFYDDLAQHTDRPVIRFYGEMGRLACRVYLCSGKNSPLDDPKQAAEMLVEAKALERRFAGLPRPNPFDLGSMYHACSNEIRALREAIEIRDTGYVPPDDRGRIHACVNTKVESIAKVIPHPAPIRLDTSAIVEPIVKFGTRNWLGWKQASDSLDLAWSQDCLYAIPARDRLVRIYDKRNPPPSLARPGLIIDVTFDGRLIWIALSGAGVWITDTSGNPVARWSDERWPFKFSHVRIFAYKEGKCLLVCQTDGRTAVLLLSLDPASRAVSQRTLHQAVVQPTEGVTEVFDTNVAFQPLAIFRTVDAPKGPVWIARAVKDGMSLQDGRWYRFGTEVMCTPLRFDPDSETITAGKQLFPRRLAEGYFVPFDDRIFLIKLQSLGRDVSLAEWQEGTAAFTARTVAESEFISALLPYDGFIHALGFAWHRLDPNSLQWKTIQERPFPWFRNYTVSAHYGLVGWELQAGPQPETVRSLMPAEFQKDAALDDPFLRECAYAIRLDDSAEERARAALAVGVPLGVADGHVTAGMRFLRDGATLGFAPKTRPYCSHQLDERWQLELDGKWRGKAEDLAAIQDLHGPVSLLLSEVPDPESVIDMLQARSFDNLCALVIENMPLTDQRLANLKCLPCLQALYLVNTQVTDAGLAALKLCKSLRILHLQGPNLTDEAVEHLVHVPGLRELTISGRGFTIQSLRRLDELGLDQLERLAPLDTNIDPMAAYMIERKSPNWQITHPSLGSMPKKKPH